MITLKLMVGHNYKTVKPAVGLARVHKGRHFEFNIILLVINIKRIGTVTCHKSPAKFNVTFVDVA